MERTTQRWKSLATNLEAALEDAILAMHEREVALSEMQEIISSLQKIIEDLKTAK